jgi:RimJ/RimL family protein N-acetyltransferase
VEILKTKRLIIHTWARDDLDDACKLWGDPKVMALIDSRGGLNRRQTEEKLNQEIECQKNYGVQYWKASDKSTGEFIGCCGLRPYDIDKKIYEIGVHIVSPQWGHGYAIEAVGGVITHAFQSMGIPSLIAGHNPNNAASKVLLKKLGFKYIGDEFYRPTGLYHPSYEKNNPGTGSR